MQNELLRFLQALQEVRDDPCDKTREALREVFSIEPPQTECPAAWQHCLGPEATPYLDIPMACALFRDAGAEPARYGFAQFCPNSDPWLENLARDLCNTRLFASLCGKKAPARNPSAAVQGAERFLLDWLVCAAGKTQYLQQQLAPARPGLYGYLAEGTRRLLQTQPLWFDGAVVPLRESLRAVLAERLRGELNEFLRRRDAGNAPHELPFCAKLAPEKAVVMRGWAGEHLETLTPRDVPAAVRHLVRLLLPYPSVGWKADAVTGLPDDLLQEAFVHYTQCRNVGQPEQQFQAALGTGANPRVLAELMQGQTPATNDLAVRLDNGLKKLGCTDTSDTAAICDCLQNNEALLLEEMLSGREKKGDRSSFALLRFLLLQLLRAPTACYGGEENLRGKLFRLGFALELDAESFENWLLQPLELPGIDYKSGPDLIRACCLNRYARTAWGYAMSEWLRRVYTARYRVRARNGSIRPPQPGRMTRYWQDRYHGLVALSDRADDRTLLDTMLRDNIPPEDLLEMMRRPDADVALHLYSSIRYRAGVMLIDLSLRYMQAELTRAQTEMQRQQLFQQQDRPIGENGLDAYRRALRLTDGIPARALHQSLLTWLQPVFPFLPPLEDDEAAQARMLQDLLERIRRGSALTRSDLMGLTVAWHLRVRPPQPNDQRLYREALLEELNALLRECRLVPCRLQDGDSDFAAAMRRALQRALAE